MTVLTKSQRIEKERVVGDRKLKMEICHDDCCGNGHNTFTMTADLYERQGDGWVNVGSGMLHEEIREFFPEYARFLKWHLCSTDGPMHYIANTLYHASDRDFRGKRKGEPVRFERRLRFTVSPGVPFPLTLKVEEPLVDFLKKRGCEGERLETVEIPHRNEKGSFRARYSFGGYCEDWSKAPFDSRREAEELQSALADFEWEDFLIPVEFSEGKEPDLEAARASAIWPDATLDQLRDRDALEKRLEALLREFRSDVESLGFVY